MSVYIPVICPSCNQSDPVKCNGHASNGKQRYLCDPIKNGCKKSFIESYTNIGCKIETKKSIIDMILNGSGIRDI